MDNEEWFWLFEFTRPKDSAEDYAGTLSESVLEDLDGWMREREVL